MLLVGGIVQAPATAAAVADTGRPGEVSVNSAPYNWAVVDYSGNLVRSNSVTSYLHQGVGHYEITFNRDIVYCSWTATIADPGTGLVYNPGLVYASRSRASTWAVHVETRNLAQGLQDYPFHLQVVCPGEGDYAVVTGGGVLARGNNATSVQRYGPGRYEVRFNKHLTNCSFIATVGLPFTGVDIARGLVFTAGGHAGSTSVYVETKNLGYGLQDYSFHLQVQCYDGGYGEWGVIDASGGAVRGNMIAGSARLGVGRYEVYLHRSVYWCSFVATVGDPHNGLVYAPGLVFTATGHSTTNAVYVETKNMGGGLTDLPFHLQISSGC
ncbi:hypothetical protein AB0H12_35235 [Actinosynnema sp. NPDC023794]